MDNFDLKKYLAENKLSEKPITEGLLDFFKRKKKEPEKEIDPNQFLKDEIQSWNKKLEFEKDEKSRINSLIQTYSPNTPGYDSYGDQGLDAHVDNLKDMIPPIEEKIKDITGIIKNLQDKLQ